MTAACATSAGVQGVAEAAVAEELDSFSAAFLLDSGSRHV